MARNRRSRSRKRKSSNAGTWLAILGAFGVLGVLIGAGLYLFLNTEKEIALNEYDLCPMSGARGTVGILLDTTDELADITKTEVRDYILKIQQGLDRFYRVSVYTMDENGLDKIPVATVCNPGRLDQMDELAQQGLTANPVLIKRKYQEFEDKITNAVDGIFNESFDSSQSPLLASMQALSAELALPANVDTEKYLAGKNKIVFVTDLLEHTEIFSNYRSGIDFEAFRNSRATEKYGKSYKDTDLNFLMIRRNGSDFTTMQLAQFWARVIKEEFKSDITSLKVLSGEI